MYIVRKYKLISLLTSTLLLISPTLLGQKTQATAAPLESETNLQQPDSLLNLDFVNKVEKTRDRIIKPELSTADSVFNFNTTRDILNCVFSKNENNELVLDFNIVAYKDTENDDLRSYGRNLKNGAIFDNRENVKLAFFDNEENTILLQKNLDLIGLTPDNNMAVLKTSVVGSELQQLIIKNLVLKLYKNDVNDEHNLIGVVDKDFRNTLELATKNKESKLIDEKTLEYVNKGDDLKIAKKKAEEFVEGPFCPSIRDGYRGFFDKILKPNSSNDGFSETNDSLSYIFSKDKDNNIVLKFNLFAYKTTEDNIFDNIDNIKVSFYEDRGTEKESKVFIFDKKLDLMTIDSNDPENVAVLSTTITPEEIDKLNEKTLILELCKNDTNDENNLLGVWAVGTHDNTFQIPTIAIN